MNSYFILILKDAAKVEKKGSLCQSRYRQGSHWSVNYSLFDFDVLAIEQKLSKQDMDEV